jgi:exopolyphosphatase/guanosine-5'-triphosphate,3'-diphosphate pyrophosphatase
VTRSPLAVVDVGSNSTRLFLCSGVGAQGPDGVRSTTITGLRRGAAADGAVTADALERLDRCLVGFADDIRGFGAWGRVIVIGTSAVRDAPNRDEIAGIVASRLETPLRVLDGPQEAELSYVGARLAVAGDDPVIVMDIGGGSTELVRGDGAGPGAAVSLDIGAVRFTEAFLHDDPPSPDQIRDLRAAVADQAVPTIAAIGGPAPLVGVAGTVTSLAAIANGAYDPDAVHGAVLTRVEVEDIAARLGAMTTAQRRDVPGLEPERAGSIVAGSLIAATVMDAVGAAEITVSERDILDGAVLRLGADGDASAATR